MTLSLILVVIAVFVWLGALAMLSYLLHKNNQLSEWEQCLQDTEDWQVYYRKYLESREQAVPQTIEQNRIKTSIQTNKIANMSPDELDKYLSMMFGNCLEIVSTAKISERDPDGDVKLYAGTLEQLTNYLGEDTVRALDFYYGEGYLERWCQMRYNLLNIRGQLYPIINKQFTYASPTVVDDAG